MTTSPASEVPMSDKDYCQIATDIFQGYADDNLEGKPLWESIKMDFEDWTKEHWDAINGKTWSAINAICLPRGVWIDDYKGHGSRSEILMKLVSAAKYDTKLKDWDMNRIKQVEETYGKVSRGIQLRKQELLIQQTQDPGFLQQPFVSQNFRYNSSNPRLTLYNQYGYLPMAIREVQYTYEYDQHQPAYVHQSASGYQPTHGPQYAYEPQCRPNDHQPAPTSISNSVPPPGKMIALDFGRYNRYNDHQPAPTSISDSVPPPGKMVSVDFGRYNIRNRCNDHQPAPTSISNSVPPPGKMIALDFGRYNICNRRNDHQPTPSLVSNPVLNSFTFKIQKDCKCIPECSTALVPPTQVPSTQAPLTKAPLVQTPPRQAPSVQAPAAQELPVRAPPVLVDQMQAPPKQVPAPVQAPPEQLPLVHAPLTKVLSVPVPSAPAPSAPTVTITKLFNKPLTELDVGQYDIRNGHNDHQPVPTRIFYPAPPTSKIQKDCECIPERSTAQTVPTQAPLSKANPVQVPLAQVLPVQAPPVQALLAQVPAIPATSIPAPSRQAPSVQAPAVQELPVQAPSVLVGSVQALSEQVLLIHAPLTQVPSVPAFLVPAPSAPIPLAPAAPITTSFNKSLTALNAGQYNIRTRRSDHQLAPTWISIPAPLTSKIGKDCECIRERSTAPTVPTQALSIQVHLAPILSAPAPSAVSELGRKQPGKYSEQLKTASLSEICSVVDKIVKFTSKDADIKRPQYTAFRQKFVPSEKVPSNAQKCCLVVQMYNNNVNFYRRSITQAYVEIVLDLNWDFYIRPPCEPISLLDNSCDSIVKVIKPLDDVPEASTNRFTIYHPHYKEKIVSNPTRTLVCTTNCLYSLCNLGSLSTASFFARDSGAYATEPGPVIKKGEPPRTSLYLLSHLPQPPSPLFSLTIFECALISGWQLSSTLASFPLLADYLSLKLTDEKSIKAAKDCKYLTFIQNLPETSLDLSHAAQTVELLPNPTERTIEVANQQ